MGTQDNSELQDEEYLKDLAEAEKNIHRREIQLSTDNDVAIANNMIIHSVSNLSLNELKLLRFIIMQTKKGDKEFFEFSVDTLSLAKALKLDKNVLYRDLDDMTTHLMKEVIFIGDSNKDKWKKFHWVDVCNYDNGLLTIKISDELKPFLIGLRGTFTRYQLTDIIKFNSVYAIRIYEILNGYMNDKYLPHADVSVEISVSIDTIRKATDTVNCYERYSSFKSRVIDTAINEINSKSNRYHVTATPYKRGRAVAGFEFLIESDVGYKHRMKLEEESKKETNTKSDPDEYKQLTMSEFFIT